MPCPRHNMPGPFGSRPWPCLLCWWDATLGGSVTPTGELARVRADGEPVVRTLSGPLTYADANDDDGDT